ncbi:MULTISPECIES: hypothetical protein [unclassified Bradyrhizobium]|uniref:hypothetical protein n=1 Tax=unclassified Bradyrhizobium TaxID=2631580 RepID=UPI0028F1328E|nr:MULTISPECIES: hypothetical protein [unclassified Bradyrhizobium]
MFGFAHAVDVGAFVREKLARFATLKKAIRKVLGRSRMSDLRLPSFEVAAPPAPLNLFAATLTPPVRERDKAASRNKDTARSFLKSSLC